MVKKHLLELAGAEVDLVRGVLVLQDLLERVVGRVRLAAQVALQARLNRGSVEAQQQSR